MVSSGDGSVGATNCGRKARKKTDSFGFRMLSRNPVVATFADEAGAVIGAQIQRALAAPNRPRHVEKVGDAGDFEGLERQGTGVEQGRQAEHGRCHMGHDPERAPQRRQNAAAPAPRQADGDGVEHAGARCDDDDQRGEEEVRGHGMDPRGG